MNRLSNMLPNTPCQPTNEVTQPTGRRVHPVCFKQRCGHELAARPATSRYGSRWLGLVLLSGLLLVTPVAEASGSVTDVRQPDGERTPIRRASAAPGGPSVSRPPASSGKTLLLLGLLLAGAITVRRVVQVRRTGRRLTAGKHAVRVLSRQQVDAELCVRLLQIGERVLIVGSTAHGLATLADVTDPAEVARLSGATSAEDGSQLPPQLELCHAVRREAERPSMTTRSVIAGGRS